MAKQSAIQKNNNRKVLIDRLSEKRKKLKSLLSSKDLPFEERVKIQMKLESLPRNSSRIRSVSYTHLTLPTILLV